MTDRRVDPCALVIFGASGDLTRRKLLPALYTLSAENRLPDRLAIVGVSRREMDFSTEMNEAVKQFSREPLFQQTMFQSFARRLSYVSGDFLDDGLYERLKIHLEERDRTLGIQGNRVFYIATPPEYFPQIIKKLSKFGMVSRQDVPFSRVIIEKPFGHDLTSAQGLTRTCLEVLREEQIFRIDHYLGKETVQNILVFRFANGIFEPLWNQKYIDHVQITVAESIGIEGRGSYYEQSGALRDMVQNHLFQLLSLLSMEPPVAFSPKAVRDEKVKVLQALREIPVARMHSHVVRAQYKKGIVLGKRVVGYLEEPEVSPCSRTETYVAMKVFIDNWRWGGVPFYLRTGKRLLKRSSEIAITFRSIPHVLFSQMLPKEQFVHEPNVLVLRIQPDEGISLHMIAKEPGATLRPRQVSMDFRYGTSFASKTPEAYERLLLDALLGDSTLFIRSDEIVASWAFCDRILHSFRLEDESCAGKFLLSYEAGSEGPAEADALIRNDGKAFRSLSA